jgi:hypothetical protein
VLWSEIKVLYNTNTYTNFNVLAPATKMCSFSEHQLFSPVSSQRNGGISSKERTCDSQQDVTAIYLTYSMDQSTAIYLTYSMEQSTAIYLTY